LKAASGAGCRFVQQSELAAGLLFDGEAVKLMR
jgi:hypothetical protein